jgi:hypothetical protein
MSARQCLACGAVEIMAVSPGAEPERIDDLFADFTRPLSHGAPERAWCLACWRAAFAQQEAA